MAAAVAAVTAATATETAQPIWRDGGCDHSWC
jgi:hypothetical protein